MESFLKRAWKALTAKLGSFAAFIPSIASQIEVGIRDNDTAKILKVCDAWDTRAHETRETLDAGDELMAHLRKAVEPDPDGVVRLTAAETGTGLLLVEKLIDEAEDIVTGVDEDDAPATP